MLEKEILEKIQNTLSKQLEKGKIDNDFNQLFYEYVCEFTLRGGKRIRPALVYYTYLNFSNTKLEEVLEVSTFIEYIQSWLLIHDDIMDHDEMRRGKPTVHTEFEKVASEYNFEDQKDFGNTFAILAGDYSSLFAFETLGNSSFDGEKIKKILAWTAKQLKNVVYGQNLDIITCKNPGYTLDDLINISELKTATYTFSIPCISGAILGGANDKEVQVLTDYSKNVGIAFQLRDDILGLFGDEETTGKSNDGDIQEGKKTILVWKALQEADEKQKLVINKFLGKVDLTKEEADEFRKVIVETGALKFAEDECKKYVDEAKLALEKLPDHENEGWKFLNWIADFMLERKK